MNHSHPAATAGRSVPSGVTALVLSLLLAASSGCGHDSAAAGPADRLEARPYDGLLDRPALRDLVDLQTARDAPGLVRGLAADDPAVRARAALALASVQSEEAVPALLATLADPSPAARRDAAFALGLTASAARDPAVAESLATALGSEDVRDVRGALIEALGRVGRREEIDALAGWTDPRLEAHIALALGRALLRGVPSDPAIDRLAAALRHVDPDVRRNAAWFFGRNELPQLWRHRIESVRSALESYGLDDPAGAHLLLGLGRANDRPSRPLLRTWLGESPDWRTRVNAATAIGFARIGTPDNREGLLGALDDPSTHVRIAAAEALAEFSQPEEVLDRVEEWIALNREDWRAASPLLTLLARNRRGEPVLRWVANVPADRIERRVAGLAAVAYVSGPEAMDVLRRAAESPDPRVAGAALDALAQRWRDVPVDPDAYFAVLAAALRRGDVGTVSRAAPLMGNAAMVGRGSVPLLMEAYRKMRVPEDLEAMTAVLRALGEAGDPAAVPVLRDAERHPHRVIRAAAARGLDRLGLDAIVEPGGVGGTEDGAAAAQAQRRSVDWARLERLGHRPRLVLETERGRIVIRLYPGAAPQTVDAVTGFAEAGQYDDVPFHRVVPNFVIQGGDFDRGDGLGGPGFQLRTESTTLPFGRGIVGMASAGRDTEGSQYFMTHSMQPHLDGRYTAFGRVVEGMDVVDRVQAGDRVVRALVEPSG